MLIQGCGALPLHAAIQCNRRNLSHLASWLFIKCCGHALRTFRAFLRHCVHPLAMHLQEFLRVGYYTQNEYEDETLRENPPDTPDIDKCGHQMVL